MKAELVPATDALALAIAGRARRADAAELWASNRHSPIQAMVLGMRVSLDARVGTVDGEPICMFGVASGSLLSGLGAPWMISTDGVERHARIFLRHCRPALAAMVAPYRQLENWVDARNTAAIRWLRWLGFRLDPAVPYGIDGLPFHRFHARADAIPASARRMARTTSEV